MPAWLAFVLGFGCGVVAVLMWAAIAVASEPRRQAARWAIWERAWAEILEHGSLEETADGD